MSPFAKGICIALSLRLVSAWGISGRFTNTSQPCPRQGETRDDLQYFLWQEILYWAEPRTSWLDAGRNSTAAPTDTREREIEFTAATAVVLIDPQSNQTSTSYIRNTAPFPTPTRSVATNSDGTQVVTLTFSDFFQKKNTTTVIAYPTEYFHQGARYGRNNPNITEGIPLTSPTIPITTFSFNPIITPIPDPNPENPSGLLANPVVILCAFDSDYWGFGCPDWEREWEEFQRSKRYCRSPPEDRIDALKAGNLLAFVTLFSTSYVVFEESQGPGDGGRRMQPTEPGDSVGNPLGPSSAPDIGDIIESMIQTKIETQTRKTPMAQPVATPTAVHSTQSRIVAEVSAAGALGGDPPTPTQFEGKIEDISAGALIAGSLTTGAFTNGRPDIGAIFTIGGTVLTAGAAGMTIGATILNIGGPALTTNGKTVKLTPTGVVIEENANTEIVPYSAIPSPPTGGPMVIQGVLATAVKDGLVIGSTTLKKGGPAITIDGKTVTLGDSGVKIIEPSATTTIPLSIFSSPNPNGTPGTSRISGPPEMSNTPPRPASGDAACSCRANRSAYIYSLSLICLAFYLIT